MAHTRTADDFQAIRMCRAELTIALGWHELSKFRRDIGNHAPRRHPIRPEPQRRITRTCAAAVVPSVAGGPV